MGAVVMDIMQALCLKPQIIISNQAIISQLKENGNENKKFYSTYTRFYSTFNE